MTTITDLVAGDNGTTSLDTINDNFDALNTDKLEVSAYTDATTSVAGKTKLSVAPLSAVSPIAVGDNDPRVPSAAQVGYIPTADEKAALDGTGTPAAGNKFVTNDTLSAAVSDIDADIAALAAGLVSINRTMTASGDIEANDSVYLTASNTVKQMIASAFTQAVTTVTGAASTAKKQFQYSNGTYVQTNGATYSANVDLTINAYSLDTGEGTLSGVASGTIFSGGGVDGAYYHDICEIGTGKYMIIWQKETGGSVAAGIFATCVFYNGSFSIGTTVAIETTGLISNNKYLSVSKVDTDKALIIYRKDSDSTLYGQVLTVGAGAATTITTNTPVQISSRTNAIVISAQITTNTVLVKYSSGANMYARVVTVSGTIPTIGAENTLTSQASSNVGGIARISDTKFLWCTTTAGTNINSYILTISGDTVTNGSTLMTSAIGDSSIEIPITIIGTTMALISGASTNPTATLLDISGATPTLIQSTALTGGASSAKSGICKVKPWTYIWSQDNDNVVIKLTPPTTLRIGVAPSAIASAATGSVSMRYQTATLTGLTVGTMYIDDDSQPTANASLTAPVLGTALTTTTILLS